eukprot:9628108-Lingulodinium_polyedra.AAC.1
MKRGGAWDAAGGAPDPLRLPWEGGGLVGLVLGSGASTALPSLHWLRARTEPEALAPPAATASAAPAPPDPQLVDRAYEESRFAFSRRRKRRLLTTGWRSVAEEKRARILDQWLDLAKLAAPASALLARVQAEVGPEPSGADWRRSVLDVLEPKATSTL